MIIQIAGTSGSGKSYLIRKFIDWYGDKPHPNMIEGRKLPTGYEFLIDRDMRPLFLVGAYEDADTAGCDTYKSVEQALAVVEDYHKSDYDVIYEGLFMMNMTRGPELLARVGAEVFTVLQLTTPLAKCIASINARREERGDGNILKKKNTKGNFIRAENYCKVMRSHGARIVPVQRESALKKLLELLGYQ